MDKVFFTNEIFLKGTNSGIINRHQKDLFRLPYPLKKGWKNLILNRWYPKTTIDLFLAMKKIRQPKPRLKEDHKENLLIYGDGI